MNACHGPRRACREVVHMSPKVTPRGRIGAGFLAAVFLASGAASIVGSLPVEAAVIDNPVTSITVTPTNPKLGDPVRTDVKWCVPDSTVAGDTFDISLPPELLRLPT